MSTRADFMEIIRKAKINQATIFAGYVRWSPWVSAGNNVLRLVVRDDFGGQRTEDHCLTFASQMYMVEPWQSIAEVKGYHFGLLQDLHSLLSAQVCIIPRKDSHFILYSGGKKANHRKSIYIYINRTSTVVRLPETSTLVSWASQTLSKVA